MTTMQITTPYMQMQGQAQSYLVDLETGSINGSENWLFIGFQHVKRSKIISRSAITPELLGDMQWCYKNGNPQWTVKDRDHGTRRTWGNTKYHGVLRAWICKE